MGMINDLKLSPKLDRYFPDLVKNNFVTWMRTDPVPEDLKAEDKLISDLRSLVRDRIETLYSNYEAKQAKPVSEDADEEALEQVKQPERPASVENLAGYVLQSYVEKLDQGTQISNPNKFVLDLANTVFDRVVANPINTSSQGFRKAPLLYTGAAVTAASLGYLIGGYSNFFSSSSGTENDLPEPVAAHAPLNPGSLKVEEVLPPVSPIVKPKVEELASVTPIKPEIITPADPKQALELKIEERKQELAALIGNLSLDYPQSIVNRKLPLNDLMEISSKEITDNPELRNFVENLQHVFNTTHKPSLNHGGSNALIIPSVNEIKSKKNAGEIRSYFASLGVDINFIAAKSIYDRFHVSKVKVVDGVFPLMTASKEIVFVVDQEAIESLDPDVKDLLKPFLKDPKKDPKII